MSAPTADQQATTSGKAFPWHEVYAPDADAAVEFYTKALGFGTQSMEMPGMPPYQMLTFNGTAVAGVVSTKTLPMPNVPPHWAAYIAVDDVDARLAKVTEMGGKIVVEPMDIPTVGRMAMIADPQGAMIWLFKPAS
jgi:hypothetical protein